MLPSTTTEDTSSKKSTKPNKKKKKSQSSRKLEPSDSRQTRDPSVGGEAAEGDGDSDEVVRGWGEPETDGDEPMRFDEQDEITGPNRFSDKNDTTRPEEIEDDHQQDHEPSGPGRRSSIKKQKRKRARPDELEQEQEDDEGQASPRESAGKTKPTNEREDGSVGDPIGAPHPAHSPSGSGPELDIIPVAPPAISHKEQRKRRKLARLGKVPDQPPEERPRVGSSQVESIFTTSARTKYGVWVGNLLFTTTAAELHAFFEPCGKLCRLNMPPGKREHEHNKGFAYVDFESEQAQEAALAKSETSLAGRKLLIKRATDYTGRPTAPVEPSVASDADPARAAIVSKPATVSKTVRKILDRQKQPAAPCLYLGNLGFETTTESITAMFDAHNRLQQVWKPKHPDPSTPQPSQTDNSNSATTAGGAGIRKVRMGTFEDSGRCKGFAFVDFHSVQQATSALIDPKNHTLDGRSLVVEYASPDAVRRGGGGGAKSAASKRSVSDQPKKRSFERKAGVKPSQPASSTQPLSSSLHMWTAPVATTSDPDPEPELSSHEEQPPTSTKTKPKLALAKPKPKQAFMGRQKPGAALANAKRASVGIVRDPEKVGTKIVFD